MGWIELAAPARGRSRSPGMAAVCPFTTAFPAAPESPSELLRRMGIVVRVANSFTASKTPPSQALKDWCRILVVGETDVHLVTWGGRPQACLFLQARIGRQQFKGLYHPLGCWRLFLRPTSLSRRIITENRDVRSPISSYNQTTVFLCLA